MKVCSLEEAAEFRKLQKSQEERPFDFRLTDGEIDDDGEATWVLSPLNEEAWEWLDLVLQNVGEEVPVEPESEEEPQTGIVTRKGLMLLLAASALSEGWKVDA